MTTRKLNAQLAKKELVNISQKRVRRCTCGSELQLACIQIHVMELTYEMALAGARMDNGVISAG